MREGLGQDEVGGGGELEEERAVREVYGGGAVGGDWEGGPAVEERVVCGADGGAGAGEEEVGVGTGVGVGGEEGWGLDEAAEGARGGGAAN